MLEDSLWECDVMIMAPQGLCQTLCWLRVLSLVTLEEHGEACSDGFFHTPVAGCSLGPAWAGDSVCSAVLSVNSLPLRIYITFLKSSALLTSATSCYRFQSLFEYLCCALLSFDTWWFFLVVLFVGTMKTISLLTLLQVFWINFLASSVFSFCQTE